MSNQYIRFIVKYLLPIAIIEVVVFSLFRCYFIFSFYESMSSIVQNEGQSLYATLGKIMVKGFRFDIIVISYIFIFPLLALAIIMLTKKRVYDYVKYFNIYLIALFTICTIILCTDIPYYKYFFKHPTESVFNWLWFGNTFEMLLEENSYYQYYGIFIVLIILLVSVCISLGRKVLEDNDTKPSKKATLVLILSFVLCYFGTNGQFAFHAIDRWASYFTIHVVINDMAISPIYYFAISLGKDENKIDYDKLMPIEEALEYAKKELQVVEVDSLKNPISRIVIPQKDSEKHNVVIIYLESFSSELLNKEVNGKKLTPFLDSLCRDSYYFENFYSSGTHTNNAIGATLSGYPARFSTLSMSHTPAHYQGLATTLKKEGYSTMFFITHDLHFDNMIPYFQNNRIDTAYNIIHYPKEKIKNSYGVQDDYLLEFSIGKLNDTHRKGVPFFANILTISNHPPYVVPDKFKAISDDKEEAILAFVDNSLENFFREASTQEWYENTLFFIQGDHGKMVGAQPYSMPLSLHHVPLIVTSPLLKDSCRTMTNMGTQMDIFPTVMGLLNIPYVNNTLGTDLFATEQPYTFFTSDKQLGCIDSVYFYTLDMETNMEYLYRLNSASNQNIISSENERANKMRKHALSMIVTANYLEEKGLVEEY